MNLKNLNSEKESASLFLVPQIFLEQLAEKQNQILELLKKIQAAGNHVNNSIGDYISETDAKKLLGRKTTWFWNMRNAGQLPFTKVGNKNYYAKSDILKLFERKKTI